MVRCPFTRQTGHPGYDSLPIHPSSVSKRAKQNCGQCGQETNKQTNNANNAADHNQPPWSEVCPSRSRVPRSARRVAKPPILRRHVLFTPFSEYRVSCPWLIENDVSTIRFSPVVVKFKSFTISRNTISKPKMFETTTTGWTLCNFIGCKERRARGCVPSMPNTINAPRLPTVSSPLVVCRPTNCLPTREIFTMIFNRVAICAPCNGA